MVLTSDDYQPKSTITRTKDGYKVNRTFYFLADSDLEAVGYADIPAYNSTLTVPPGSGGTTVYLTSINVSNTGDGLNDQLWFQCDLGYEELVGDSNPVLNQASWSVSLRPRQITVSASNNQSHVPSSSTDPRWYGGPGINVTDNGAEGVQIDESVLTLTVKHWISPGDTTDYLASVYAMRDKVNDDTFSGPWGDYDAYTTRYMGFELTHINGEIDQVSHEFLYVPNETRTYPAKLYAGGEIELTKYGHEYIWSRVVEYVDSADDTKKTYEALDVHLVKDLYTTADFDVFVFPF